MCVRIFYMISADKQKLEGKTHLSYHTSPLESLKKSSGLDGISNQLLKLSLLYTTDSLTYIFNLCIEKNFQSELLKAKVVLLPKYNDKTIPTNQRPISLMFCQSFQKSTHTFKWYLEYCQLLLSFQPGFRCKYFCNTALGRLANSWLTAMNKI